MGICTGILFFMAVFVLSFVLTAIILRLIFG